MEEFLNENLSNVKYKRAAKLLKEATDGKMKLRKKDEIFKESKALVAVYQIENTEYSQKQPASSSGQGNDAETSQSSQSLSTNLERDAETNKIF